MVDANENLVRVARVLQSLGLVDAVFVGGATVESYITDPALLAPRVTVDVDVVVDTATRRQFYGLEARLRDAGHEPTRTVPSDDGASTASRSISPPRRVRSWGSRIAGTASWSTPRLYGRSRRDSRSALRQPRCSWRPNSKHIVTAALAILG